MIITPSAEMYIYHYYCLLLLENAFVCYLLFSAGVHIKKNKKRLSFLWACAAENILLEGAVFRNKRNHCTQIKSERFLAGTN